MWAVGGCRQAGCYCGQLQVHPVGGAVGLGVDTPLGDIPSKAGERRRVHPPESWEEAASPALPCVKELRVLLKCGEVGRPPGNIC